MHEIKTFLRSALSEIELAELNRINATEASEFRQLKLRDFFHRPEIFSKVTISDPAWVSYEIFINGKNYEF